MSVELNQSDVVYEKIEKKEEEERICVYLVNNKLQFYSQDTPREIVETVNKLLMDLLIPNPYYHIEKEVIVDDVNNPESDGLIYKVNVLATPYNQITRYRSIADSVEVFRIYKNEDTHTDE